MSANTTIFSTLFTSANTTAILSGTTTANPFVAMNTTYNYTFPWWVPPTPSIPIIIPVVHTRNYWYYSWTIYIYITMIILVAVGLAFTKVAVQRRRAFMRQQQRAARQRQMRQGATHQTGNNNNASSSTDGPPKPNDLPPAYDDVVQQYIDGKQQWQTVQVDVPASVSGMLAAASTLTIETNLDSAASVTDLSTAATTTAATITTIRVNEANRARVATPSITEMVTGSGANEVGDAPPAYECTVSHLTTTTG